MTFIYGGRTYGAEEFSSVYQAVDAASAVVALPGYDPVAPYDEWTWSEVSWLETASGFDLFGFLNNETDNEHSFVMASLDENGARTGDFVVIRDPTETSWTDENHEVVALPGGNHLVIYQDDNADTVEFLVFDDSGASLATRTLASQHLPSLRSGSTAVLTQNNEVVTCVVNETEGYTDSVLQLHITPVETGDALGTSTTVDLYDNGTVTLTDDQDEVEADTCMLAALAGGGVAVLHDTADSVRQKTHVTFFDEDFSVTSTTEAAGGYLGYTSNMACNDADECVFAIEDGGPDAFVYFKSNADGSDTFGPHPFTDHEYDEEPAVAAFEDGTFMIVSGEDESVMTAMWLIDENGVVEEKQLVYPIRSPRYDAKRLIVTGPYTAKFLYETFNLGEVVTIDLHKNSLKVVESAGSFSVTNESAHTVETTVFLSGV